MQPYLSNKSRVAYGNRALRERIDYTATWSNASLKDMGTHMVTITGTNDCVGTASATCRIDKVANPLKAKGKTVKVSHEKPWKRSQSLKASKVIL